MSLAVSSASAQTQVQGFELERLELDPSGMGSLALGSARLMNPGTLRLGAGISYANSPLVAVVNGESVGALVRDRVTLQLTAALAVHHRVEIGAVLPLVMLQLGDDLSAYNIGAPAIAGLGSPWVQVRTNILEEGELIPFDLGAQVSVGVPVGSAEALASSPGFVIVPKVLATRGLDRLLVTGELGLQLRPLVPLGVEEIGPRMTLGAAVLAAEALHPALRGLRPEASVRVVVPFTGQIPSTELLVGGRIPVAKGFNAFALLGAGLGKAPGTPRFLVSLGASYDNAGGAPQPARRLAQNQPKPEPLPLPAGAHRHSDGSVHQGEHPAPAKPQQTP
ncbi:MAG: hypothetical protein M3Y59_13300 [Myxococcota bacterium]|nr:hypothetical protein [Myxococcota bacterium]